MRFSTRLFSALALAWVLPGIGTDSALAQAFAPYSDFQSMPSSTLSALRVKLTYVGELGLPRASLLLVGPTATPSAAEFSPYERSGFVYVSDELRPPAVILATQTIRGIIDSVGTLPDVADGDVDGTGYVSFALLSTVSGTKAFEAIVDSASGPDLFRELIEAVHADAAARNAVRDFACSMGMLPGPAPSEVTNLLELTAAGLRLNRATGKYVGKVRIVNNSAESIAAPLILVARFHADASIVESDGVTCNILPGGQPYLTLVDSGVFGPGQTLERTVHVNNPGGVKLNVEYRVFSGVGTP